MNDDTKRRIRTGVAAAMLAWLAGPAVAGETAAPVATADSPQVLYQQHCSACHGGARLGLMGPALLPDNLARLRKPDAAAA